MVLTATDVSSFRLSNQYERNCLHCDLCATDQKIVVISAQEIVGILVPMECHAESLSGTKPQRRDPTVSYFQQIF